MNDKRQMTFDVPRMPASLDHQRLPLKTRTWKVS
jgi:hypothetical protein